MKNSIKLNLFDGVYSQRRVLITGATGFKGSWLAMWLHSLGARVAGLSIGTPSTPCHFDVTRSNELIDDHRADVRSLDDVVRVLRGFRPEIVFHLAAQPLVRRSYEDPLETFTTNVIGTANVLEAIRQCDAVRAAVFVTSDKCYENIEQQEGYREIDRLGGKDPYSASKGCAELVFSSYARSYFGAPNRWLGEFKGAQLAKVQVASGRAGNVIGGGDWAADRIVPDCVRAWCSQEKPIIRSPHSTRPWQHVLEPLSGYLWLGCQLLSGSEQIHGQSFNFGPLPNVNETVLSLIEKIRSHWEGAAEPEVRVPLEAKPEAALLRLDCSAAATQLKWHATLDFNETARFTALWFQQFQDGRRSMRDVTLSQIAEYESLGVQRNVAWANSR